MKVQWEWLAHLKAADGPACGEKREVFDFEPRHWLGYEDSMRCKRCARTVMGKALLTAPTVRASHD